MGVTEDQVGSLLRMMLGMSATHHHNTVTAGQANGNEREHCNPFTKSDCTTFLRDSPPSLPLRLSKCLRRQVQAGKR